MKFRPCIDIHNGQVKQIIGSLIDDSRDYAPDNFVSEKDAAYYACLYRDRGLDGGHVIMLNHADSPYYELNKSQAVSALKAYPNGLDIGGGINDINAAKFLRSGARHVIVTSYVFRNGEINVRNLEKLAAAAGRENIVLDLSAAKINDEYKIMTDRWQKASDMVLNTENLLYLSQYCDEFLVHAVDAEGKIGGIDDGLVSVLCDYIKNENANPITYAGGISSVEDIYDLRARSHGKLDYTVGSALDLFGGKLSFEALTKMRR